MSIEKYLNELRFPVEHPGPFAVKMKYDVKKRLILSRKHREHFYIITSSLGVLLFILSVALVTNPNFAIKIHDNFATGLGLSKHNAEEIRQLEAERLQAEMDFPDTGIFLGGQSFSGTASSPNFRQVATGSSGSSTFQILELSQIEEGTPYIIRKVKDSNNRDIYFINEISNEPSRRLPY